MLVHGFFPVVTLMSSLMLLYRELVLSMIRDYLFSIDGMWPSKNNATLTYWSSSHKAKPLRAG